MTTIADRQTPAPAGARHTRRALSAARGHLQKSVFKLLGWLVFGYLLVKLVPDFKQALRSLEHVSWEWVLGALALEVLSEVGYVTSWRAIVDPENLLGRDPRGVRISTHAAWAQLGGGMVVPGGSLASIGVGAWILRRFGMPDKTIAERQFNIPGFAVVVMAYIIGALGGSIPLPAGIGAVGGIAGMLILYGVGRSRAVAAVLIYEAVGLLVPLIGGAVAYLLLRREFGPMRTVRDAGDKPDDDVRHPVTTSMAVR